MRLQNRWLVLAIVSSALFLIGIDMTVLYTALPRLTHDLGATASQKLWIINAFPLVMAGLLPGSGALGDRFGHRRVFCVGLAVFGLASVFAAFAPTAMALIAGRAILAVGAALMLPATLALLRLSFLEDRERALALGIWGAIFSGAAAVGPIIGGALLARFWWGSVFLINLPVVLLALPLTLLAVPRTNGNPARKWDAAGSVLIMLGLVGIVYALKEVVRPDRNLGHLALAVATGAVFMTLFLYRQAHRAVPLIDFALFRIPGIRTGIVAGFASGMALMGVQLAFSQKLQLVQGLSALEAGMAMMPIALSAFLAGPVGGLILPRLGIGRTLVIGLLTGGAGLAAMTAFPGGTVPVLVLVLFGFGSGLAMSAASSAIMLNAPEDRAGMAASLEGVTYEVAGTLGVAVLGSLLSTFYALNLVLPAGVSLVDGVHDSLDQALIAAETLSPDVARQLIDAARRAFGQSTSIVIAIAAALQLAAALYIAIDLPAKGLRPARNKPGAPLR